MTKPVSQWWDIRAENGDLLSRIKALSYEDALAKYVADRQRQEAARGTGTALDYADGMRLPTFPGSTLH